MSAFGAIISGAYAAARIRDEARGRQPRPFSFSAYGQGVSIGHGGVGFFTYPDDGDASFVLHGRLALRIRNLFVWMLVFFLKLERKWPGSALFWILYWSFLLHGAGVPIAGSANVGIAGQHIRSFIQHGGITRSSKEDEITVDDVERLASSGGQAVLPAPIDELAHGVAQ
jgi:hypothetical protein